ncbi:NADH:ubiquinone oxidoreductase subunit 4 (chain M) [Microbacterium sp. GXF7504]
MSSRPARSARSLARLARAGAALLTALTLAIAAAGCSVIEDLPDEQIDQPAGSTVVDDDLGRLTVYEVDIDGELMPAASETDAAVWDMFRRVATPEYAAERILWYQVGDNPDSDTLAWVIESDEDPSLWNLTVNLAGAEDDGMLLLTLIHEYAHLLSMGPGQTDESGDCEVPHPAEPCTEHGAYLDAYYDAFWAQYGADAPSYADENDEDEIAEFLDENEEDFVSAYAATNVGEDFAETFTVFVAEPRPDDKAASEIAEKLAFMWEWPELVEIRDRLRAEFGDITWVEY